jgi:diacylglycerol kinase family enzyme
MNGKDILLIANPGAKAGDSDLSKAVEFMRGRGFVIHREFIDDPRQITESIERFAGEVDGVVLGGGDGTFSRAAAALLKCGKPLGILPMGTANDLARTLGIPLDLVSAAGIIAGGHPKERHRW